jgi:hypothetical protein
MSVFPFLDLPIELAEQILLSADVPTVLRVMQVRPEISPLVASRRHSPSDPSPDRPSHSCFCLRFRGNSVQDSALLSRLCGCHSNSHLFVRRQTHAIGQLQGRRVVTEPTENGRLYLYSKFYVLEGGVFAMLDHSSNSFFIARSQVLVEELLLSCVFVAHRDNNTDSCWHICSP